MPTTFADLGVPEDISSALRDAGITDPFPIQAATLADSLAGLDLCGRAPTGSGKTLAFGIPLVARVTRAEPCRPTGLVLVPTRELAGQVTKALVPLARARRLYVLGVYGGVGIAPQIRSLARGASIVVATPGRLLDLMEQRAVELDAVEVVVLDEADRMADMGFLPQVRKLLDRTPTSRQTMLWSATLDGDVDRLVQHYQRTPRRHELVPEPDAAAEVTHSFWRIDAAARPGAAAALIRRHRTGIVFVRTRHGADRVVRQLAAVGLRGAAIHGNRTQAQREKALDAFRSGAVNALVATDVAARGIHVDDVGVVVHWDPVEHHKDYVHRSGRTGRAGSSGTVVSLVTPEASAKTAALQRALGLPAGLDKPAELSEGGFVAVKADERPARVEPTHQRARRGHLPATSAHHRRPRTDRKRVRG